MADHPFIGTLSVTGNVGIGAEPLPDTQLYIFSRSEVSQTRIENSAGNVLRLAVDKISASIGTDMGITLPFSIQTNGTPRITINSAGDVAMTGLLTVQNNLSVTGNVGIGTTASNHKLAIADGDINIDDGRALRQAGRWVIGGNSNVLSLGSSNAPDGRDIRFDPGFAGALTIKKDTGNVGIGTTQPGAKLEVVANSTTWGGWYEAIRFGQSAHSAITHPGGNLLFGLHSDRRFYFADMAEGQYIMTIDANPSGGGNVGIGTTAPTARLQLSDGFRGSLKLLGTSGVGHDFGYDGGSDNSFWFTHYGAESGETKFVWDNGNSSRELLVIKNNGQVFVQGNVGIGTTSPKFGLDVRGNNHWIGSGDSSQSQGGWRLGRWPDFSPNQWVYLAKADSTKYQDLAVGALWAGGDLRFGTADDLAEMTPVKAEDNLEPGDVVVIENPPDNRVLLARSNKPYDSKVAGVISDASTAGLIIGGSHPTDVNRDDIKPLALAGRVLTKVTTENGSINAGDFLTTSSKPGHAMKATVSGHTLGKALQSFNDDQNGENKEKIWVLVNLGMI